MCRYRMTREQSVFFAKRNIIDSIWKEANIEGVAVTFPQTEQIYQGYNVGSLTVKEVLVINNLKHAWQFLLDTLDVPVNLAYISQVNKEVGASGEVYDAGSLRVSDVNIGGTEWIPDLPVREDLEETIREINEMEDPQDKAVTMMLFLMRSQCFNDGNKRTAQIVANKIMIENGCGLIGIPVSKKEAFFDKLIHYYETNDAADLKGFIINHAIIGMSFEEKADSLAVEREEI